ncbi:hypothetical protein ACFL0L_01965 [Patescibacteria group bacterium]
MNFLSLSIIFLAAGLLAIIYYLYVPTRSELVRRLPNKISLTSVFLALVIGGVFWYTVSQTGGMHRVSQMFMFLFGLLLFESFFLIAMKWVRSNFISVIISLIITGIIFYIYISSPSFIFLNIIIILVTLGGATLLIRMRYLRTGILFTVAILWTIYDIMLTQYLLPTFTVPVESATPTFMFPAVTVEGLSLGSGDFMFLVLFALILLRDFGKLPAIILVGAETIGLLIIGMILPESDFLVPFLLIMTPIFIVVYALSYFDNKRKVRPVETGV